MSPSLKDERYAVVSNEPIADLVYKMVLKGDTSLIRVPGQFVNLKMEGLFLRRPISVCDWDSDTITLIYKVVGRGTEALSEMKSGKTLDVLSGLGNGFDQSYSGDRPLLVGGGVGVPPLYALAKRLISSSKKVTVILGFNSIGDIFYVEEFKKLGAEVIVTTVDGSFGKKGFVTDVLDGIEYTYVYSCGPIPMLKALNYKTKTSGQFSFEERMGCGFGACMGCSHKTVDSYKRICKEGPVLFKEEIIWQI